MTYFTLSIDPSAVGYFPQTSSLKNYQRNHPDSFTNARLRCPIKNLLVPEKIELRGQAKWTDLLGSAEITIPYIIISQAFWEVISSCKIPPTSECFPVQVSKGGKTETYQIFIGCPIFPEFIDFNNSPAVLEDTSNNSQKEVFVKNAAEFQQIRAVTSHPLYFFIKKPKLNIAAINLDIFRLGPGSGTIHYFVSEDLVIKAQKANLKGLLFTPAADAGFI